MAKKRSIGQRIASWGRTVRWVEEDPADLLYEEYENALNGRNWLAVDFTRGRLSDEQQRRVHLLDERFRAATLETPRPWRAPLEGEEQAWWWFRIPRELQPAFLRSMEYEVPGLADEMGYKPPAD